MKILGLAMIGTTMLMTGPGIWAATNETQKPLPTLKEIFPKVVERAQCESENDRTFESQYVFVRSKVTEFRNAKGELKKREAKTSTNDPALKKIAARPAPAPTRKPGKDQPVSDTHSNVRGRQFEQGDFSASDLVKRFEFTLVGRETLSGRPMLVIDFQPAKGKLPERNLKDKFVNKAAGRVWLDEEDYAIVKVALHLTDRVNVLGGLVGAVWKFTYGFERERTPDGLWFTRDEQWHLEGREVFVQRIVDFQGERTGVRKPE